MHFEVRTLKYGRKAIVRVIDEETSDRLLITDNGGEAQCIVKILNDYETIISHLKGSDFE